MHVELEPELDGRHGGLKAAATLVPGIHQPELHGRHGGLKAGAGDPRGPGAQRSVGQNSTATFAPSAL